MNLDDIQLEKVPDDLFNETYIATVPNGSRYHINISYELAEDIKAMKGLSFLEELRKFLLIELQLNPDLVSIRNMLRKL